MCRTDTAQMNIMCDKGMFSEKIIGLDLEWSDIVYPTAQKKAQVYSASMLILTSFRGTILYHLFGYQDANWPGLHWPGPLIQKQKNAKGKWMYVV